MGSKVIQYQSKIQQLLDKLLTHSNKSSKEIELQLEELLNQFKTQDVTKRISLLRLSVFTNWLLKVVRVWELQEVVPNPHIVCFAIDIAALLMRNEDKFTILSKGQFLARIYNISKIYNFFELPFVQIAYVKCLFPFLEHKSGFDILISFDIWSRIMNGSWKVQQKDILEEIVSFLALFLEKLVDHDQHLCSKIIKDLMISVHSCLNSSTDLLGFSNFQVTGSINFPTQLLCDLIEFFFEKRFSISEDCRLLLIFFNNFQSSISYNSLNTIVELQKIILIMQFLQVYINLTEKMIAVSQGKFQISQILNTFIQSSFWSNFEDIQKIFHFSNLYCTVLASTLPILEDATKTEILNFPKKILALKLMPNFALLLRYVYQRKQPKSPDQNEDVTVADFMSKVFKMTSPEIYRCLYFWRDHLLNAPNLLRLCINNWKYLKIFKKYFCKDQAVFVIQSLIYTLKGCINFVKNPSDLSMFEENLEYLQLTIEILRVFLSEFEMTWKDGLEIFDIMDFAFQFMDFASWSGDLVVNTLRLINTTIVKYMTPNLALLVDRTSDSTVNLLGPLLIDKLHDKDINVKVAALEIVWSILQLSEKEFSSFQEIILEYDLPEAVANIVLNNEETLVRAEAMRCLQEIAKVEIFWKTLSNAEDLPLKMAHILKNDRHTALRKEAATFLMVIYDQRHILNHQTESIYKAILGTTDDISWEVKTKCLRFWEKVIQSHLEQQGMIDGSFPDVTFSKEHRKIIQLTEFEIRLRLRKILSQLSTVGCLNALKSATKDSDIDVSKLATKITKNFLHLLDFYHVIVVDQPRVLVAKSSTFGTPDYDDLITSTVCVKRHSNGAKVVTPSEFLAYARNEIFTNGRNLQKNPLRGIEDLEPLIDDMLTLF